MGLIKFIIGFFLGIILLLAGATGIGYYFFSVFADTPPKPIFDNDPKPKSTKKPTKPTSSPQASIAPKPDKPNSSATPTPTEKASSSPTPTEKASSSPTPTDSPSPSPSPTLEPGAYRAKVTWSTGLSLRKEPARDAERIGGVAFDQKIIILKESEDKQWQKIRVDGSTEEGWVPAGNIQKLEEESTF